MATARGSFEYPVIASGYVPQGAGLVGGQAVQNFDGATVVGAGVAGQIDIVLDGSPNDPSLADANIRVLAMPAPGSGLGGQGISFDMSATAAGHFGIRAFRNDTGAAADVPYFVVVLKRVGQTWQ